MKVPKNIPTPKPDSPLEVPMTTFFTRRDAKILEMMASSSGHSVKQIIRYATRKYIAEHLYGEHTLPPNGGE